ncbi:hypothetical protein [Natrinema thermotolerans]
MGTDNPPPTDEKPLDEVYHDRNLLAIAFARAIRLTWGPNTAGWYWHDGWRVVWVDTPTGQKSWHVTPVLEDVLERLEANRATRETPNPSGRDEPVESAGDHGDQEPSVWDRTKQLFQSDSE